MKSEARRLIVIAEKRPRESFSQREGEGRFVNFENTRASAVTCPAFRTIRRFHIIIHNNGASRVTFATPNYKLRSRKRRTPRSRRTITIARFFSTLIRTHSRPDFCSVSLEFRDTRQYPAYPHSRRERCVAGKRLLLSDARGELHAD